MVVKKCCIKACDSCSSRQEDIGVTYHKYPKNTRLHESWISVTKHKPSTTQFVCSRHFCKSDFQIYKDSKYLLKSDAVPSIFPWTLTKETEVDSGDVKMEEAESTEHNEKESKMDNTDKIDTIETQSNGTETSVNVDKTINEKEFQAKNEISNSISEDQTAKTQDKNIENDLPKPTELDDVTDKVTTTQLEVQNKDIQEEKEIVKPVKATENDDTVPPNRVMDMIHNNDSKATDEKKDNKALSKTNPTPEKGDKNNVSLSVGSKVEAKDFEEYWYPAQIMEVDYEEMEVLVHYENVSKKHDEWISVSSPRLRPLGSGPPGPSTPATPKPVVTKHEEFSPRPSTPLIKEEPKEEKPKLKFVVGERCLARWRDGRRFIATVQKKLPNGDYEIVFDDGFHWTCSILRLSKLKDQSKTSNPLSIDTTSQSPSPSILSPVYYGAGPSTNLAQVPAFHTHLFDPARDYLGSKSERRERKRKLNIKEIFNIGQKKYTKKKKVENEPVPPKKPKIVNKKVKTEAAVEKVKNEIPDAVASIIGTCANIDPVKKEEVSENETSNIVDELTDITSVSEEIKVDEDMKESEIANEITIKRTASDLDDSSHDPVSKEEVILNEFDEHDTKEHVVAIDKIKEAINKLEDGLNQEIKSEIASPALSLHIKDELPVESSPEVPTRIIVKFKKSKKIRMLQEKKVKKQVEKVKSELEQMKKQIKEMRKQMLMKTEELAKKPPEETPESFLLPGEWCCKWVNGNPVGTVSELETDKVDGNKQGLPRRSVQVEDKRLPAGWTKHMVRRSLGNSAGKWDVVLVNQENKRFHTKTDMRNYLENNPSAALAQYEHALYDFGVHMKLSKRMGWVSNTSNVPDTPPLILPAGTLSSTSPIVKRKKLSLKKKISKESRQIKHRRVASKKRVLPSQKLVKNNQLAEEEAQFPPLEDGYVYCGSLKVQVIENLLRCPAEGCFKNFRNDTLLKMHIKHYHRELRKMLGATPKVLDLAHARTKLTEAEIERLKREAESRHVKVKISRPPKREEPKPEVKETIEPVEPVTPVKDETEKKPQDSPKLRNALVGKVRRPKVLLPVRRVEEELDDSEEGTVSPSLLEPLDFESAISTHTVTKPVYERHYAGSVCRMSEEEDGYAMNSDVDTMSSYPRSGSPDSKNAELKQLMSSESNEEQLQRNYVFTETGERVKIVHMKREEIINCHCGIREEDGLMVQCELCLCWQHAYCHNIQSEAQVPEKYTCSICLNPRRGRRSQRFLHDQDRLYEGLLPGAKPCETLRRSHELSGNLLLIDDSLHSLRVKYQVATKKNHPKLYLWAKDWDTSDLSLSQDKFTSDYSDLNIMLNSIGKENLPMKDLPLDDSDGDRLHKEIPQSLLSGLLSSPGGVSLDLPISTSELERLAKSVQEQDFQRIMAPQPEAPIDNNVCRERLLRHIQRCQAVIDARLDSLEAQVAELESQDPSFEDDETADYFPRTKQTVQMLMRDLDTMEDLGVIT